MAVGSSKYAFVGLVVIAPLVLVLVNLPFKSLEYLLVKFSYDDTFIYLQVARQWILHGFATFDGSTPTNGFQPLWQLLLLPPAALISNPELLFRTTVLVCGGMALLTLIPLYAFMKKAASQETAIITLGAWALLHLTDRAVSGMEESLSALLLTLVLWKSAALWEQNELKTSSALELGILVALVGLTRFDLGICSAFFALPFVLRAAGRHTVTSSLPTI